MKSIEIVIKSLNEEINVLIDVVNKRIILNNKMNLIKEEQIDELLRIIRLWDKEYLENNYVDGEKFFIRINIGNEVEVIKGQGNYSDNYQNLKDWIGEFYE